jgi:hypothetical protein
MAWKTSGSSLLSPLLRWLSDIRPQHAPIINARGLLSPKHGWLTLHLKPDNPLLINSQAVYRPSLVENSRVTMSSVEQ